MDKFIVETKSSEVQASSLSKPNGLDVEDMFDARLFQCGAQPLDPSLHTLRVQEMDHHHRLSCVRCREGVDPGCYFAAMRLCVVNGWRPPVDEESIAPAYSTKGNYPTVLQFQASFEKEFEKMKVHGVAKVVDGFVDTTTQRGLVSPMGAVIKNSDRVRSKALGGICIVDQQSLSAANDFMKKNQYPEIKARVAHDLTATGINRAAYSPSFRYPSLHDYLRIVSRGSWQGKTDISRYFHSFPIVRESWWMFFVSYLGVLYVLIRCCFGFAPCPYYCSTWSAEFRSWILAQGIPSSHMMDDFATCGKTEAETTKNLDSIDDTFRSVGFSIADKREIGQCMVFLGVLVNLVAMTLSFDAIQSKGMLDQLSDSLAVLKSGGDLDQSTTRHTAGRLGWYSEVLQSGRLHTKRWWAYSRFGSNLSSRSRADLVKDCEWWVGKLRAWSAGGLSGREYPILTADELLSAPNMIYVVQSDASGDDGFGFVEGLLEEDNPQYVSRRWCQVYQFVTSHNGELQSLLFWVRNTSIRKKFVLWVSDCLSAVWSVNKGGCHEDIGFTTLSEILELCDEFNLFVVALWCPREHNRFADYLSHLSVFLDRSEARGRVHDLVHLPSVDNISVGPEERHQGVQSHGSAVRGVERSPQDAAVSSLISVTDGIRLPSRPSQQGVHEIGQQSSLRAKRILSSKERALGKPWRVISTCGVCSRTEDARFLPNQPSAAIAAAPASSICGQVGFQLADQIGVGGDVVCLSRRFAPQRRIAIADSSHRRGVGIRADRVLPAFVPIQDPSYGGRILGGFQRPPRSERGQIVEGVVRPAAALGTGGETCFSPSSRVEL